MCVFLLCVGLLDSTQPEHYGLVKVDMTRSCDRKLLDVQLYGVCIYVYIYVYIYIYMERERERERERSMCTYIHIRLCVTYHVPYMI